MSNEIHPGLLEAINHLDTLPLIEILTTNKHDEQYFNEASRFIYNDIVKSDKYKKNCYYILSSSLKELCNKIKENIKEDFFDEQGNLQNDEHNSILYYLYVQALTLMLKQLNIDDIYDDLIHPDTIEQIKISQFMPLYEIFEIDDDMMMQHFIPCITNNNKNYTLYQKFKYYKTISDFIQKLLPRNIVSYEKKSKNYNFNKMDTTKRMHVVLSKLAFQQLFDSIGLAMIKLK